MAPIIRFERILSNFQFGALTNSARWGYGDLDECCPRYLQLDRLATLLFVLKVKLFFVFLSRISALPTLHCEEVNTNSKVQKVEESNPYDATNTVPRCSRPLDPMIGTL